MILLDFINALIKFETDNISINKTCIINTFYCLLQIE